MDFVNEEDPSSIIFFPWIETFKPHIQKRLSTCSALPYRNLIENISITMDSLVRFLLCFILIYQLSTSLLVDCNVMKQQNDTDIKEDSSKEVNHFHQTEQHFNFTANDSKSQVVFDNASSINNTEASSGSNTITHM